MSLRRECPIPAFFIWRGDFARDAKFLRTLSKKSISNKRELLSSLTDLAKRLRRTPSLSEFVAHTRYARNSVCAAFGKWNVAVREAGLKPHRVYARPEADELLEDWGKVARSKGGLPKKSVYLRHGNFYSRTLEKRFGGWASLPAAFRAFARGKPKWADVVSLIQIAEAKKRRDEPGRGQGRLRAQRRVLRGRSIYGDPIDFRGLRHQPVNEQGVVLLFGMVAEELGYRIESVQKGFPDCEAMRRISPERWQRVRIEFEYESKNFRIHGHDVNGCDVIVCWRHNWPECPKWIEIVELSRELESLSELEE